MTNENTYNGWKNYETWNCALWLSCDYSFDTAIREYAESVSEEEYSVIKVADYIEELVDEVTPELPASMFCDLLTAAIGRISYYEIAEAYLEK